MSDLCQFCVESMQDPSSEGLTYSQVHEVHERFRQRARERIAGAQLPPQDDNTVEWIAVQIAREDVRGFDSLRERTRVRDAIEWFAREMDK